MMAVRVVAFQHPSVFHLPGFNRYDSTSDSFDMKELLWPGCGSFQRSFGALDDFVLGPQLHRGYHPSRRICRHKSLKKVAEKKPEDNERQPETEVDEEFRLSLDVSDFRPEELSVRTVGNKVIVEGRHEEKQDEEGYIEREFRRTYLLPEGVDPDTVKSSLSCSGLLSIEAPKRQLSLEMPSEKSIPIERMTVGATCDDQTCEVTP